jgi:hypothetical protein
MRIEIDIPVDGGQVTITAIDLAGDAWADYVSYRDEGRDAHRSGDIPRRNRALRSALIHLFAHLEGVAGGLYNRLQRDRPDFAPFAAKPGRSCTLKAQISGLTAHASRQMGAAVQEPTLRYKPLRDILVHPYIKKSSADAATGEVVELTEVDLFKLSVEDLEAEGAVIDAWLNQICGLYAFTRFHDTLQLCATYANELGNGPEPHKL